jgi:ferredoxin
VKNFQVAREAVECDFIVSLPKLKTHTHMYYTGAMKNLFGAVPGLQKTRFHFRFPEKDDFADMLIDLNLLLKPAFAVMDAVVSMEGKGPSGGDPFPLGLVLASADVLALDIIACGIIGYRYQDIPMLDRALKRETTPWVKSAGDIEVKGESPEDVKPASYKKVGIISDIGFFKKSIPGFLYRFIKDVWVPRPFFNKNKCIRCGRCVEICSAKALRFVPDHGLFGKHIKIDRDPCIRCYCCHEICPVKAVNLRRIFPFL